MSGNQQFIVAILIALIGPLVSYLNSQAVINSQQRHADENANQNAQIAQKTDSLKTEINGRMTELLVTAKSDSRQLGMTEEREKQNTI